MISRYSVLTVLLTSVALAACSGLAPTGNPSSEAAEESSDWGDALDGFERRSGLLDVHVHPKKGSVLLELPSPGERGVVGTYLYVEGLTTGLGSNPVGLDRGQLGETRVVELRRIGSRLLIEAPNLRFRALSDNAAEVRATREAFATSVLWAGEVLETAEDGRSLVDITSFVVRDAHDVVATLAATGQGSYRLDADRSMLDPGAVLAFPDNLEFEALLTFAGDGSGGFVQATAPMAQAITLRQHHSLIRLPDDGYHPRRFDPRMGSFAISFSDYATPLGEPIQEQWIVRHRLERTDPEAESSAAVEPIVYYVDSGAPEPIRSALIEGATWWAEAFEAAGFEDAFRVELLPEGAHPLDVRYNVIQWVHRSTRGWSYGGGVIDPRTGEMIKGHVTLGSLRVRQDILLFEGLTGVEATGNGGPQDPIEAALARIRQLSAHEVGHTLGFAHNFAASTYGRASVMDYPAPFLRVVDGRVDLSDAYDVGIGAWDRHAADFAYRDFPDGTDEDAGLAAIVERGLDEGMLFLSDADARPEGAAQPKAGLWDNGSDSVAALAQTMEVRGVGLEAFGASRIATGRPMAALEEVFAPLYFHHRYQLGVTAKQVGGVDYRYKVAGDDQPLPQPVSPEVQHAALATLAATLSPEALEVPANALAVLHPRSFGLWSNRELFAGATDPLFDPVAAGATAADLTVRSLLAPERLNRVAQQHAADGAQPGVGGVLAALADSLNAHERTTPLGAAVRGVWVEGLMRAASSPATSAAVRSELERELERFQASPEASPPLARRIARFWDRALPPAEAPAAALEAPPGSPIGGGPAIGSPADWLGGCSLDAVTADIGAR